MRKTTRVIISLSILLIIITGKLFFDRIIYVMKLAGPCRLYHFTGIYCPACGGTRSLTALLRGDILASLRYNVMVIFFALLGIALYIEFILKIFNKNIKLVPRSDAFVLTVLALSMIYSVVRNFIPYLVPAV